MRLNTPGILNKFGKTITPFLSRAFAGKRMTNLLEVSCAYLNCLIGKGAGTGWDRGEELAASRLIRRPDPVILDIGANQGLWTQEMRRLIGEGGKWILIEPAAECCLKLRSLSKVEVIEAAVGEQAGRATLFTPENESGLASLYERRDTVTGSRTLQRREVQVLTIDEILAARQIEIVDLMKMDLEGHELFALRGATQSFKKGRIRALTFEFGAANVNSRTFFRDTWALLKDYNFTVARIYPGGRVSVVDEYSEDLEFFRGATNYIAAASGVSLGNR